MGRQVGDSFSGLSILPALDYYLFKRHLFVYICSFQQKNYGQIVDFSGIPSWIVGIEGEHADHLTTTTAI